MTSPNSKVLSDTTVLIQPALRELDLGRYVKAKSLLTELRTAHEADTTTYHLINTELVRVHLLCGAFSLALDVVDGSLARYPVVYLEDLEDRRPLEELDESCVYLVLLMQKALAAIMVEGRVNDATKTATRIAKLLPTDVPHSSFPYMRQLAFLESYYHKIFHFACEQRLVPWDHLRKRARQRLQPLIAQLYKVTRYAEAMILTIDYCRMLDSSAKISEWKSFLFELYAHFQYPSTVIIGSAHLELARAFSLQQHQAAEVNMHLALALTCYTEASHRTGHLQCRQLQTELVDKLAYPPWSAPRTTNAKAQIMLSRDFEARDDTVSLLGVVRNIQQFAYDTWNAQLLSATTQAVEEIVSKSGSWFLDVLYKISQVSILLTQTGHSAKILESINALMPRIEALHIPYLTGLVATITGQVYEQMHDGVRALALAQRSYDEWSQCGEREASAAATQLMRCRQLVITSSTDDNTQNIADLILYGRNCIEKDVAAEFWSEAVDKLSVLMTLELDQIRQTQRSNARDTTEAKVILDRIFMLAKSLPKQECLRVRALAIQNRSALFFLNSRAADADDAVAGFKDALKLYIEGNMLYQGANIRQQLGLCYLAKYQETHLLQNLIDAQNEFQIAYDAFQSMGSTTQCISAAYFVVRCWFIAWASLGKGNSQIIQQNLALMLSMEKWIDYRRQDLSVMSTIDAILQKQALARDGKCRELYSLAQRLCLTEGLLEDFWTWVQKGKARSVADLLALGVILPETVRQAAKESPAAWALLERRDALLYQIQHVPPDHRINLRNQSDDLQNQMAGVPELHDILALQMGWPLNLDRLRMLFDNQRTLADINIVMVDWVSTGGQRLVMMVVDKHLKPQTYDLAISVAQVESWIAENFTDLDRREQCLDEDVDDPDAMFRQLDPLVAPLRTCTKQDDLLVFCATAPLHALPLHALNLHESGQQITLIKRNPIVYCPSLTIYEQCINKALHVLTETINIPINADHSDSNNGVRLAAVYDASSAPDQLLERNMIQAHIQGLAAELGPSSILWDAEVTKNRLCAFVEDASLIHFHGHCHFDEANALRQKLVLARKTHEEAAPSTSGHTPSVSSVTRLTESLSLLGNHGSVKSYLELDGEDTSEAESLSVGDIFSLSLKSSPHVTLIACDSASQAVNPGDEPLGIATAFLCAGAASFVGTLWSMRTREGRAFSDKFYASFQEQSGKEFINLANALQSAVIDIMEETESRAFRYWAPLVLHGAWFHKQIGGSRTMNDALSPIGHTCKDSSQ